MTSRIKEKFESLKCESRTGLVTYVTAGDPDSTRSAEIIRGLDRAGADVIEVGVAFSDPLADGPVIQRASERALAAGATLLSTLKLIGEVRQGIKAPIVLFSYVNPILKMGTEVFAEQAASVGIDGVLVLDLPIEEAGQFRRTVVDVGIDPIFLLSPTTTNERIRKASALGSGFLYGISRLGVTGPREKVAKGTRALVERVRAMSSLPIVVGFGLSSPEHVRQVGKWADAAVVGSALVEVIARESGSPNLVIAVEQFVAWLKEGAVNTNGAKM